MPYGRPGGQLRRRERPSAGWRRGTRSFGRLGRKLAPSLRGQTLVRFPLLANFLLFFGRQRSQGPILLPRRSALFRGQACPCAHLLPNALLLVGGHLRKALRDPAPLLFALRFELVPIARKGGQNLLFRGREVIPCGRTDDDGLCQCACGRARCKHKAQRKTTNYSSIACFSQF